MKVIFILNASKDTGLGHLLRCRELAAVLLERNCDVTFLTESDASVFESHLDLKQIKVKHHANSGSLKKTLHEEITQNSIVIIDLDSPNYHEVNFQKAIKGAGATLAYLTVNITNHYLADFVISYNITSSLLPYQLAPATVRLTGLDYFIFRNEFRKYVRAGIPKGQNLFINFGGSDPQSFTAKAVETLKDISDHFEVVNVVYGPLTDPQLAPQSTLGNIHFHHNPKNLFKLMATSSAAICGTGTTFYELSVLNIPCWIAASSPREIAAYSYLTENKMAIGIGDSNTGLNTEKLYQTLKNFVIGIDPAHQNQQIVADSINLNGVMKIADALLP